MTEPTDVAIEIRRLCAARGRGKSICPSETAQRLAPDDRWRDLMLAVRETARTMARAGEIELLQKGEVVDPDAEIRGPFRLRIKD